LLSFEHGMDPQADSIALDVFELQESFLGEIDGLLNVGYS
jgi:hypothetical protein